MNNKESFEYGGYHFVPERQLTGAENNIFTISRRQCIDKELGFCRQGYVYESKYPYSTQNSILLRQIRNAICFVAWKMENCICHAQMICRSI